MRTHMGNENASYQQGGSPFGPQLPAADVSAVNDDPAQILDVLTLSERETEHSGVDIDVSRFAYGTSEFSLGDHTLDQLLADSAESLSAEPSLPLEKECDPHEHN